MQVRSLGWEDPLKEGMTTYSSILAWRIPWTEQPGGYSPWGRKKSDTTEVTEHILWNMGYVGIFPSGSIGKETTCKQET